MKEEQLHLPSPNVIKNLIRLATRENKSGDQNVGVQDDRHRISGLFSSFAVRSASLTSAGGSEIVHVLVVRIASSLIFFAVSYLESLTK